MLNKVALTTLGLLSVFAQAQYAQPQYRATVQYAYPQACTGVCVDTHDPSIIRRESDGLYFRFSTGGLISIHTAPNITGPWTFACKMLSTNSKVTQKDNPGSDLWAPDVSLVGDTYYVYYSVSTFGTQDSGIGLAKSTSMDCGTFTDAGSVGISSREGFPYNAIDANLLNDGGVYRITFGSFWNNLYQVQMNSPLTKTSSSSAQLAYDPAGLHQMESPSLIKVGSYYYLLSSVGQCCGFDTTPAPPGTEYHIKVCRSKSPNSGFVDQSGADCRRGGGTTILASHDNIYGPGGQFAYKDPIHGWILAYHYVNTKIGYADGQTQFGWNYIEFSSGWPVLV